MRAARFVGTKEIRIEELAMPAMQEDDVKIAVAWAGICGSDKHGYERPWMPNRQPYTPGHEFSGTVIEVGSAVSNVAPGDNVVVNPMFSCGVCYNCKKGYRNLCESKILYGLRGDMGAFAEETIVKDYMTYKIPDYLPLDVAAVAEPACIGFHGLRLSKFKPGDTAAVFGVGAIGMLLVSTLKASGCTNIIATARTPSKLELAKELGATVAFNPEGPGGEEQLQALRNTVDVAFEVSEAQSSFNAAMTLLRARGELVILSLPSQPFEYRSGAAIQKEISILTANCTNGEFPMMAELLASGAVNGGAVISKRIFLDDIVEEGYEALSKDSSLLKVLVTPNRELMPK